MKTERLFSEVYAVLMALDERYVSKTPTDIMFAIDENRDEQYLPTIDSNKALDEQGLDRDAIAFIFMLKRDYWCETEEEKNELLALLQANETDFNEQLAKTTSARDFLRKIKENK